MISLQCEINLFEFSLGVPPPPPLNDPPALYPALYPRIKYIGPYIVRYYTRWRSELYGEEEEEEGPVTFGISKLWPENDLRVIFTSCESESRPYCW